MVSTHIGALRLRILLGMGVIIGIVLSGCATTPPPPSGPSAEEVGQRLAALEDCVARSQQAVDDALKAGVSVGDMFPISSKIADAQVALGKAKGLLKKGQTQKAMDRANKALQDCNKLEVMAMKIREESLARAAAEMKMHAQAEAQMAQMTPCIEAARRAIHSAEVAGATDVELRAAKNALANAEFILEEAKKLLAQGEVERALTRLEIAHADCLSAQDMGNQVGIAAATRGSAKPGRYTVMRGDTLWGISASAPIYDDPFMWPLLYKANRDQIRDPDLIRPNQVFAVPRQYSQEEASTAIRRARTRGPWRLGDGPDYYILEGVRR